VFVEEVEEALKRHPAVEDAVVCGRPSERWGQEVVAIVELRSGATATAQELRESCADVLADYKLPRAFTFCDEIARSPAGKADYRWARRQAEAAQPV
jgi:acyl-CoA synthetase (AMP-forming)/AMP-acid ligase II